MLVPEAGGDLAVVRILYLVDYSLLVLLDACPLYTDIVQIRSYGGRKVSMRTMCHWTRPIYEVKTRQEVRLVIAECNEVSYIIRSTMRRFVFERHDQTLHTDNHYHFTIRRSKLL